MRKSKKISDASIRVLETLKFLHKNNASVQDIIHHFEKIDSKNRIYTSEVILKYINTLKVFGMRFAKEKDKYVLLNTPYPFNFDEKDMNAINIMERDANILPEQEVCDNIHEFLQDLERMFSDNTRCLSNSIKKTNAINNLGVDYQKYAEKVKKYEKYCLDRLKIKITYINVHRKQVSAMVEPNEIKYMGSEVYLSVYNPLSAQIQDVNLNSIIEIYQLPLRANSINMFYSVIFKLKGNLALSYKLHESEKLLQLQPNGDIFVLNQKEDRILLLKRLMRYGEYCEIISPKSLREEMLQVIKATLSNYN